MHHLFNELTDNIRQMWGQKWFFFKSNKSPRNVKPLDNWMISLNGIRNYVIKKLIFQFRIKFFLMQFVFNLKGPHKMQHHSVYNLTNKCRKEPCDIKIIFLNENLKKKNRFTSLWWSFLFYKNTCTQSYWRSLWFSHRKLHLFKSY